MREAGALQRVRYEVCLTEDLPLHPHLPVMASGARSQHSSIPYDVGISCFILRETEVKSVIAGAQIQRFCIRRFRHMMVVPNR